MNKTVVITGSARGLGFEMAKQFLGHKFCVSICDVNKDALAAAKKELECIAPKKNMVLSTVCDVTNVDDLEKLWAATAKKFGDVSLWVNNAGVNQPMVPVWELDPKAIDRLVDIDLKGAIYGSKVALAHMKEQGHGAVYCIEGFGADDATQLGLTAYGASKKGVQYLVRGLATELKKTNTPVQVGRLNPGIMITNFITHPLGDGGEMELDERTKKVYNILGDYPDVVAQFLVKGMVKNVKAKKQDDYIAWLTTKKAAWRFMTAAFNKRDFFAEDAK